MMLLLLLPSCCKCRRREQSRCCCFVARSIQSGPAMFACPSSRVQQSINQSTPLPDHPAMMRPRLSCASRRLLLRLLLLLGLGAAGPGPFAVVVCTAKPTPADYAPEAAQILAALAPGQGPLSGQAWDRLAEFTDTVGNRVSGSANQKRAVDYMLAALKAEEGLEGVNGEPVVVPHWKRGREEAVMLSPRHGYRVNMLGLGTSVGTVGPRGGEGFAPLVADVVVVSDWDELEAKGQAGEVNGKIVLLNPACDWAAEPVGCYGQLAGYRGSGASKAAAHGAVACLVRSLASDSIGSPHTGMQSYAPGTPRQIPAAAVAVEDAEAMARMQARGQRITLQLYMEAENLAPALSHNVVAEWRGAERPEEAVLVSGHLDSWDVGVGAMDDGGGVAIAWQALSTLRALGLRPKRTVRLVLWASEEFGGVGAHQYFLRHKGENLTLVVESDIGAFKPTGLAFTGSPAAAAVMDGVAALLAPINASALLLDGSGYETDTGPWAASGVPGASLASHNERYFAYHHSNGDQMRVLSPSDMDLAAAVFAVTAFVVADLDDPLPRNERLSAMTTTTRLRGAGPAAAGVVTTSV